MSSLKALEEIKKTESEAQKIIEKAKTEAADLLRQAKKDSVQSFARAEQKINKEKEEFLNKAEKEARIAAKESEAGFKSQAEKVSKLAAQNNARAQEFIIQKITK